MLSLIPSKIIRDGKVTHYLLSHRHRRNRDRVIEGEEIHYFVDYETFRWFNDQHKYVFGFNDIEKNDLEFLRFKQIPFQTKK